MRVSRLVPTYLNISLSQGLKVRIQRIQIVDSHKLSNDHILNAYTKPDHQKNL
jgi:hypothetical protein